MEPEGQQNPSANITAVLSKRAKLHEELKSIERQVYEMETSYLQDPMQCGNVLKGFEGYLSSTKNSSLLKRSRKFQPEDRLFSLSSATSPATEEHAAARDAGGISAHGQGKPKKGRPGARDVRRIRQSSEPDFDYEDELDFL